MKDRYERKHRRTASNPEAVAMMANADFSKGENAEPGDVIGRGKAKHTPGPWTFDGDNPANQGFDVALSDGGAIATAYYCEDGEGRDEAEANARLIAAAPELLAALKELAACLMDGNETWDAPDDTPVYDTIPAFTIGLAKRVSAAIAKAEPFE